MNQTLSEELIAISTMMMVAQERGEMIRLAGRLNETIGKAMEIERLSDRVLPKKTKTLSALIKFTKKEVDKMSKTFKKEFIANGLVAHVTKRQSGKNGWYYEIRYRRNGYNISISNKDLKTAKERFIRETHLLETPEKRAKNRLKFGVVLDEWLEYKKGKIDVGTWKAYCSNARRFIPDEIKSTVILQLDSITIDRFMQSFSENPRRYEDIRTLLNSVFKFAILQGIITHNPVAIVPFKRAKRTSRQAMTRQEAAEFLRRLKDEKYDHVRQYAYALYFFGLRPCEVDKEAHFENGFLIARNRKRHGGKIEYKKIPVPKQAQGLIDFDKPLHSPFSYSKTADILSSALGEEFTLYCLRHTFATFCAESVNQEIVEIWLGDSPERLIGKFYVHYQDDFMRRQMDSVNFATET